MLRHTSEVLSPATARTSTAPIASERQTTTSSFIGATNLPDPNSPRGRLDGPRDRFVHRSQSVHASLPGFDGVFAGRDGERKLGGFSVN